MNVRLEETNLRLSKRGKRETETDDKEEKAERVRANEDLWLLKHILVLSLVEDKYVKIQVAVPKKLGESYSVKRISLIKIDQTIRAVVHKAEIK